MKKLLLGLLGMLAGHFLLGASQKDHLLIKEILVNGVSTKAPTRNPLELKKGNLDLIINLYPIQKGDTLSYQLLGFDIDSLISTLPQIRYTNLPGGEYKLKINLRNTDRRKNRRCVLNLNKQKFWHEKWWASPVEFFSFLVLSTILAYLWTWYYRWQQRKEQKLRDQISSDLHDEVGSSLSSIIFLIKSLERKLKNKAPEVLSILQDIYDSSSTSIDNLRDAVWVINPKNDTIGELLDKMRSFAYLLLPAAEIHLDYYNAFDHTEKDPNKLKINTKQRRNAFLIFKEILNNVVKHAQAKTVTVNIERENNGVKIFVKDDGVGMDLIKEQKGNGLKNFKKRAKESLIDLKMISELGKGTSITLFIPEL